MINRADKSGFADWWFTVDRVALLCMVTLAGIGLMLAFAASPATTGSPMSGGDFRYSARQVAFAVGAVGILCGVSLCARSASWRR
jgi:cell division protein FtsW